MDDKLTAFSDLRQQMTLARSEQAGIRVTTDESLSRLERRLD
jgi:hypothetical protein